MERSQHERLVRFAGALIDQEKAQVIVPPNKPASGYWFGGGNLVEIDGTLYLVGRYRNAGDSTTGLGKGERGLELAIFASTDGGHTFKKQLSWNKDRLGPEPGDVLSIEGAALNVTSSGVELFVSTEKRTRSYPEALAHYQKPGTGVWSIDRIAAPDIAGLAEADVAPLIECDNPEYLHVKDPVVHTAGDGSTVLLFCTHPFGWSSSNSAYCIRRAGEKTFGSPVYDFFGRGFTWDVAVSRITDVLALPGSLLGADGTVQLVFYDGAECLRAHTENAAAVNRPRGYSCEEIGGLAVTTDDRWERLERISSLHPLFMSPYGSGSSRYVHTLAAERGIYAVWQQAQNNGSQPLVMHFLSWDDTRRLLAG